MKTRQLFFLLILLLAPVSLSAQEIVVKITVLNPNSFPIPQATVELGHQKAVTDENGIAYFRTGYFPVPLTAEHPDFERYEQIVRFQNTDTITTIIKLFPKATDLDEVVVTSEAVIRVYPKPFTHIIDFKLNGDGILLICKENQRYFLRKLKDDSEVIAETSIPRQPLEFYTDCTNGLHLLYADSAYEIMQTSDSVFLLPGITSTELHSLLDPCALSSDNHFIFRQSGKHNKAVQYTLTDRSSLESMLLYSTSDDLLIRSLDEYAAENNISNNSPNLLGHALTLDQLHNERIKFQNQQHYKQNLSLPIYVPVFRIYDSLMIWDHFTDTATVFSDNGIPLRSFTFGHHYFDNWKGNLILNEEKNRLFACYEINGLTQLREIDAATGTVLATTTLREHVYPEHIQIRGNFIYYIFHRFIDDSINYIYKQRIGNL